MKRDWSWLRQRTPLDLAIAVIVAMALASMVITPSVSTTLPAVLLLGGGLLLSALMARWPRTHKQLDRAWGGLSAATGLLFVIGLWGLQAKQRVAMASVQETLLAILALRDRFLAPFPDVFHPNVLAGGLVVLLPFSLTHALRLLDWRQRSARDRILSILSALAWLMGTALVLLTQSRGAYFGLAASLVALAVLWPRSLWVLAPLGVAAAGLFTAAGGWSLLSSGGSFSEALFGLGWRQIVWATGLQVLASFGYTGVGMGCFGMMTTTLFPMAGAGSVDASHAHNLFLQVGIDLGVPGLIGYVAVLGLSVHLLHRAYRAWPRGCAERLLPVAALCALAALLAHGLVDVGVWGSKGAPIPWVVVGLAAAVERLYTPAEKAAGPDDRQ